MSSIIETVKGLLLNEENLAAIATHTGGDAEKAETVVTTIVPKMLDGFSEKAAKPGGPEVVLEVLGEQDSSLLDGLPAHFEAADNKPGSRIMRKILPGRTTELVDTMAADTGLSKSSFKRLIPLVMPVVATTIAGAAKDRSLDADSIASFLVDEAAVVPVAAAAGGAATSEIIDERPKAVVTTEEDDPEFGWIWWVVAGLITLAALALILGEIGSDDDDISSDDGSGEVEDDDEDKDKDDDEDRDELSDGDIEDLQKRVDEALAELDLEDGNSVSAEVQSDGSVLLSGEVTDGDVADSVEAAMVRIVGFDNVDNELEVPGGKTADGDAADEEPDSSATEDTLNDQLGLDALTFEENSAVLTSGSQAQLRDTVLPYLLENADEAYEVQGHTNNIGDARDNGARNAELSEQRAAAVREFLVAESGDDQDLADRLTSKGFGSSEPLIPHNEPGAVEANRRVVLVRS